MSNIQKHRETVMRGNEEGDYSPPAIATLVLAGLYLLSGVTQPLIMSLAKEAGLAEKKCQLYMLFYYFGPASVMIPLLCSSGNQWPSRQGLGKAACIAVFDLAAQAMNYTGSGMAGPTIFAIIYSSVTVWTAVFSRILLGRSLTPWQWLGVVTVFGGLAITGLNSASMGPQVFYGSCLVLVGSSMHALTYVLSEAVMTKGEDKLSIQQNCAIQGVVCCLALGAWQIVYTRPRWDALILQPMKEAHTSSAKATVIFLSFSMANFVHAITFFHTLKHFWGGSTSAGVLKGLQAVLVFLFTSLAYCGRFGGPEMCFSPIKFASLIIVVGGVLVFGKATERAMSGYTRIEGTVEQQQV